MIQRDNAGHVVATQTLVRERDLGLLYRDVEDLAAQLKDAARMERLRDSVWRQRDRFTFDNHAERLLAFFREVIVHRARGRVGTAVALGGRPA